MNDISLGPDIVRMWHPIYEEHISLMEGYIAGLQQYFAPLPDFSPLLAQMRRCAQLEDRREFMNVQRQLIYKIYEFLLLDKAQDELEQLKRALKQIGDRHE